MDWYYERGLWRFSRKLLYAHVPPGIVAAQGGVAAAGNVSFINSVYSENSTSSVSHSIDISGSGRQSNDFILLQASTGTNGAAAWNVPTGFTALTADLRSSSNVHTARVFYKQSNGSEGVINVSYTVAGSDKIQLEAGIYRGVDWSLGPFGATVQTSSGAATSANPPAVTTQGPNELVICGYAVNIPTGTFPTDAGGPSGFTVRMNRKWGTGASDNVASGFGDMEKVSPGSVDPDQWTWGGNNNHWIAWTVGVRPA